MTEADPRKGDGRIAMLDGWRALSILSVLAGHWVPLGRASWQFNGMFAATGMALFFTLSGFLITQHLWRDDRVGAFLVRRLFRVVPLAWTAMLVLAIVTRPDGATVIANLLFYANLPPAHLMDGGHPLWSLCVEMHFYLFVAAIVAIAGKRALYILPFLALAVTTFRIASGEPISIVTWHRVDEILAGATLALAVRHPGLSKMAARLPAWTPILLGVLLLAAGHPDLPALNYVRPYLAAATIGASLYAAPAWMRFVWSSSPARYVADISYALYIVHGMFTATWLGGEQATTVQRYLRRPLLAGISFATAHLSTFHYESRWNAMGRRLTKSLYGTRPAPASARQPSTPMNSTRLPAKRLSAGRKFSAPSRCTPARPRTARPPRVGDRGCRYN